MLTNPYRRAIAPLLGFALVAGGAAAEDDPYDDALALARSFSETMFEQTRARPEDCADPPPEVTVAICAAFDQSFSTFKFRWETGLRIDFAGEARSRGSWRRKPGGYVREYTLGELGLTVRFVETGQRLELEFRRPEESPEEDAGVSTRLKLREELLACPSSDELPDDPSNVTPPALIAESDVDPSYPEAALDDGSEGSVTLRLLIGRDGQVKQADLIRCDNPGHGFEESAAEAARQWRYEPARVGDRQVEFCVEVIIEFNHQDHDRVDPPGAGA